MPRQELFEYVKEAAAIQVVKMIRNKGGSNINWRDLAEDEILSFIYDDYVHDSTWGKMIMDEQSKGGGASEAESVIQKTIYLLAMKWIANAVGIGRGVSVATAIDIGGGLFLKDYLQGKTSVGN